MSKIYQVFQGPTWRGDYTSRAAAAAAIERIHSERRIGQCHRNHLSIEEIDDGCGDRTNPHKNGFWND